MNITKSYNAWTSLRPPQPFAWQDITRWAEPQIHSLSFVCSDVDSQPEHTGVCDVTVLVDEADGTSTVSTTSDLTCLPGVCSQ